MGNVCKSVLIGNSRIEDHVFRSAMIFGVSGQKNTGSLCSWILLSRAADAEHGMVVVMLRMRIRMKMSTPTSYTSQPILRSSVSWLPLGSNFGETWCELFIPLSSSLPPALAADSLLIASGWWLPVPLAQQFQPFSGLPQFQVPIPSPAF